MKGNFDSLVNGDKPVLVDFYADWCAPCKVQTPILHEISAEMNGKVRIIKIDVDRNRELASRYHIRGVPTLMLFRKGRLVWNQPGITDKKRLKEVLTMNL